MPKKILTKDQTTDFLAKRDKESEIWDDLLDPEQHSDVSIGGYIADYMTNEQEATNGNLQGTDAGDNIFDIEEDPGHPRPHMN